MMMIIITAIITTTIMTTTPLSLRFIWEGTRDRTAYCAVADAAAFR